MKESRVKKYKKYRDSISKESKKSTSFFAPSKEGKVSTKMELFLKLERKNLLINVFVISLILLIVILLVVFGLKLF